MWMTWLRFRRQNAELAASTLQLLETTVRKLVYGTALIILIWCLITGYQVADFLIWRFWVVLASLVLVVHVSLYLVPKAILPAIMVWVGGLFLVNILVIVLLELPQAAFLLPAYPFFAVSAIGWPAGVMMVAVVGGATVALAQSPFGAFLAPYQIAIMVGGLLNGYVGWVVAATLIDEVRDTLFYYGQARDHMEEARTHRAKLMHVLKDLDRAYYSLERANGSLVAAWRKAEQAERFKAEFVTHLSHEMRTPLNLILGFSETILMSQESYAGIPLPGAYREDINKINRNAQHLMALINDVIDLSRADVNRIPLVREEVQVQTLVMDTVNMVSDYIHSKGLELKVTVDGTVQTIVVDVLRIRQVLLNLLVNAARFTDQGGIELQVTRQSEHISFKIIDSGRGINPKALPHIFEAYHSDTPQVASWSGSSGLGLPISKTLVELHGGHIEALSDLGKGTEFRFTLPQNQEVVSTAARSSSSPGKPVLSRLPSPAIVVAGQDPQAVNTMQRLAEGYTIVQATTCNQAVALLQEHQAVALIVPSSPDGIAYSDCPENVLMIECSLPGLQQAARTLGVLSVLEKPVQPTDLVKTLEAVVPPAKRILIVDDDVDLVQLFQRILAPSFGIENCLGAYSGAEALKILHQERIDVLLLDLAMPEIDGRDVLEALRRAQDLQHVQVIVISGTVQDAASVRVQKEIRLSRRGGLTMGEATRVITATATALSPGWHSLGPDTERFEQVPLADRLGQVGDST